MKHNSRVSYLGDFNGKNNERKKLVIHLKAAPEYMVGKFVENTKGAPIFLNAGDFYPNATLTIVIWADARKEFNNTPEEFYKGKEVCITGKIELYKDKTQINY